MSETHPLLSVQCTFLTGSYRCGWGVLSRSAADGQMCPFHRQAMSTRCHTTAEQWALLGAERAYMQRMYPFESFLNADDLGRFRHEGRRAVRQTPFWYRLIEEQWRILTGLPVPASVMSGAGYAAYDDEQVDA